MLHPAVVIIADDLTGALDAAAPFAMLGMTCLTAVTPAVLTEAMAQRPQVLSVNLGTRELPLDEARSRATLAAQQLMPFAPPGTIWLKKIDSRLKGPIAAEVMGVHAVLRSDRILFCPAIPESGRLVRNGRLEGIGIPKPLPLTAALPAGVTIDAPDAGSDRDLDSMVATASADTLFVGARGLSAAIARRICPGGRPQPLPALRGPLGFVVGSRDPVTLAQVACLRKAGGPRWVAAPDGLVPPRHGTAPTLLQATSGVRTREDVVSLRFAHGVLPYLRDLRTIVVTGGETAAALLQAANVGLLRIEAEVLPGLPLCSAIDRPDFPAIITKSGGFGAPDCLLRLWQAAHCEQGLT